ncbi:NAD(P)/FAD-dependent oxidoreductase [Rhodanobacter sp. L36]|uniref:flavin-containing monooxygenase n=1 Tax=Rhodanobacter sp. L36 TaxID=1747221 RepID=UPI00131D8E7E|nr:NAD(P)/FAD-dependent oxidoreductase [Rhodanobacter sp. L36]
MPQADVVIVGAGAAGLSAAGALQKLGIDAVLLEQDSQPGGTWARRYDRLHLHTVRKHSGLAHYPIPRGRGRYLARDEYVAYLQDYARHFKLDIVADCAVTKIRMEPGTPVRWRITGATTEWETPVVVIAVGQYGVPRMPFLPGLENFTGELIHSVDYRNASPFAGKRVLVVGAGNSGAEIATDLIDNGASFVAISVRTPPPIVPRDPFGQPVQRTSMLLSRLPPRIADRIGKFTARLVFGDLTRHGFPAADWRPYSSRRVPVIDVGFVDALKKGRVQVRATLVRLTETQAVFADGQTESFDAIIAATGFSTGLASLIEPTTALDADAEPVTHSGEPTASPGLYFIGYTHSLRGHLFEANLDSRRLAVNVATYLKAPVA